MAHSRSSGNGHCWGVYFTLAVTSWSRPGQECELLPLGVVAFNIVCLDPCENKREAQHLIPWSPAREDGRRLLPEPGRAPRAFLWPVLPGITRGPQASWLGVPMADSQRGRETATIWFWLLFPDTNPNSSGCFNMPSIVGLLLRSPGTASNAWAGSSREGGGRSEGPHGSCSPQLSPILSMGL